MRTRQAICLLFLWLFLPLISCNTMHKTNLQNFQNFDWQGHRGCRGLMPENTIPAMLKALDLGVTTLEMDAVITKDSVVVLSHEPFFNHEITTRPDGTFTTEQEEKTLNIFSMASAEVQHFDVGLKPHPRFPLQQKMPAVKPRLADVIELGRGTCKGYRPSTSFLQYRNKVKPCYRQLVPSATNSICRVDHEGC